MDLLTQTRQLLKQNRIRPDASKSQSFLVREEVYDRIVEAADLQNTDVVLEVGPGLGFLTVKLLEAAGQVVAVEIDDKFFSILCKLKPVYKNLSLKHQNILQFDETKLPAGCKLVANLPYHLTSAILKKFLTSPNQPATMTVLVQKEVAERICARAGQHTLLSLSVQFYGQPEIKQIISRNDFYPAPDVDSAVLKIGNISHAHNPELERKFWQLARIGFSSRRKTLVHNLSAGLKIDKTEFKNILKNQNLPDMVRAQELSVDDWQKLAVTMLKYN